jgi:hypothetical protein
VTILYNCNFFEVQFPWLGVLKLSSLWLTMPHPKDVVHFDMVHFWPKIVEKPLKKTWGFVKMRKFATSRLKKKISSSRLQSWSRPWPSHRTDYKSPWIVFQNTIPPRILENQCNSLIFLLQCAVFLSILFVSLSRYRLFWHSSQKFACESELFSVVALHFSRICQ